MSTSRSVSRSDRKGSNSDVTFVASTSGQHTRRNRLEGDSLSIKLGNHSSRKLSGYSDPGADVEHLSL